MAVVVENFPSNNAAVSNELTYELPDLNYTSMMAPSFITKKETATVHITEVQDDLRSLTVTPKLAEPSPELFITGLGSQYPPFTFKPERLESFLKRWYDVETPA